MNKRITPIFIIGSARNGTTNLENIVATLPQVAAVEHWMHYGSCESSLYMNKQYWGDLSDIDNYIHFLNSYAGSDYFQLANGDVNYHLQRKQDNFYEFFFDLMERHCEKEGKQYWITKLDPHFFMAFKEKGQFFDLLNQRYKEVKFLRIKRNFKDAFKSYRGMEGKNYDLRQMSVTLLPALALQASRYVLTYQKDIVWNKNNTLDIPFEEYIADRRMHLKKIAEFLDINTDQVDNLDIDRYQVNTSFVNKQKRELPIFVNKLLPKLLKVLQRMPSLARLIWQTYFQLKQKSKPIFHRLIKYKYFRRVLLADLSVSNANGLISKIKNEDTAVNS